MKAGDEVFQKLNTMVLINEKHCYNMMHLIGGGQYYKLRAVKD
jgi:hypothetical protein